MKRRTVLLSLAHCFSWIFYFETFFSHLKFICNLSLGEVRMLLPSYLIEVSFQQMPTAKLCNCNSVSHIISGNERGDTLSSLVNVSKEKKNAS